MKTDNWIQTIAFTLCLVLVVYAFVYAFASKEEDQISPPKNDFYQAEHLWRVKEVITADSLEFRVYEVWRANHWTILYVHKKTGNITTD